MRGRAGVDLAVFDVDGTIIANHGPPVVNQVIVDAFDAARAMGVAVTLATGRTLDDVCQHLAGPLGLTTPVITAQGAVLGDPVTGSVLSCTTIPRATARRALAQLDQADRLTVLYLISEDGTTRMIERGGSTDGTHDDLFGVPRERVAALAPMLDGGAPDPLKIIVEAPWSAAGDPLREIEAWLGNALQVSRTHPRLVELTAPGVDKGRGLLDLCHLLDIEPTRVLAVGDNDNDVPMLRVAGIAVALDDGSPAARAAADWVAPAFAEHGAANALRRFVQPANSQPGGRDL